MRQPFKLDFVWAGVCMTGAVFNFSLLAASSAIRSIIVFACFGSGR
jgi:hypothetical protein